MEDGMKQRLGLLICGILLTGALYAQSDEAAIREVVRKYVAARDTIDPRAIQALFTTDAD
jgi:hypothetical protein